MSSKTNQPDEVFFTPAQMRYLEDNFPHVVLPPTATEATMRYYFGQQSVLESVRRKLRGVSTRTIQVGINDIPAPGR